MDLLLLSNSTNYGEPYLGWCRNRIAEFLRPGKELIFVPYAGVSITYSEYENKVNDALEELGVSVRSIHHFDDKAAALSNCDGILVGGGNTFHLLATLQQEGLIEPIREAVKKGIKYVGWSAGSNIAGPGIHTTNDMPIVEPDSFSALHLVDSQINPHYTERTLEGHGGESRLDRLREFMQISDLEIWAIPEGSGVKVTDSQREFFGSSEMKILRSNEATVVHPGSTI